MLSRFGGRTDAVASVVLQWDGGPAGLSVSYGYEYVPWSLADALRALQVPGDLLANARAASAVPFPGDWVVRRGASETEIMRELERIVSTSGQRFRLVPESQPCVVYSLHGVPNVPEEPLFIFPPPSGVDRSAVSVRGAAAVRRALRDALGCEVRLEDSSPADWDRVSVCDNAAYYRQLGVAITDTMIAGLLEQLRGTLGVRVEHGSEPGLVWRLSE